MDWKQLLVSITSSVEEELRLRNAYLVAENRILRNQITGRVHLTNAERQTLAELGQQLGKKALADIATIAQPDTILAWYRSLVAQPCPHVQPRQSVGRPRLVRHWKTLWCAWPERTARGGMTALSAPWRTSGTLSVTRPWGIS